jgi:2-C-methyl-D-erythritol 4-phosphate cytidylyltransferase/2-C-methyl-D-erythritol 2,4-cyclodiphosphate synthase
MIGLKERGIPVRCVKGGTTRQDSVRRALRYAMPDADLILVHDAVRPLCAPELMQRVLDAAWHEGGAVPSMPAAETIQRVSSKGRILATPPRGELHAIQTPQCFRAGVLRESLQRAHEAGFVGTDESSVVRWAGHRVVAVPGDPANIKITRPVDLEIAEMVVAGSPRRVEGLSPMIRVGHGIDYHRFAEGRKLVLGGVTIPFEKGLQGHSDADALTHAICDALLGAAAMGDIGSHFPDSDPAHRGRPSLEFLKEVRDKLDAAGWKPRNVDAVLVVQRPKIAPFMPEMRRRISEALRLPEDAVNIKATTTERMNAEGRGEGVSAQAVALIEKM